MNRTETVRGFYGTYQLSAAPRIAARALHGSPDTVTVAALRILGGRHLLQALVLALPARAGQQKRGQPPSRQQPGEHRPTAHLLGGLVDVAHAASMAMVAVYSPSHRNLAVRDGTVAGLFALAEFVSAYAGRRSP